MRLRAFFPVVLAAGLASGQPAAEQNVDRVFHFTHTQTPAGRQETANLIRAIALIRQMSVDHATGVLAVSGTPGQMTLAEWLFNEMDKPPDEPQPPAREYRVPGSSDDAVRVFHLANVQNPQSLQEIVNTIRSLVEVQRIMAVNAQKALTMRGTNGQMAAAEWLIGQLDKPAGVPDSGTHEFRMKETANPVARVFYPKRAETPQILVEMVNSIRTIAELQRVVVCNGPKAIAIRGTAGQAALAEWLINELDQPAGAGGQVPAPHEYRVAGIRDDVVRVFYPARVETPQAMQEVANLVRSTAGVQRLVAFNATRAVALRGTGDQVARVEQLLKEREKP